MSNRGCKNLCGDFRGPGRKNNMQRLGAGRHWQGLPRALDKAQWQPTPQLIGRRSRTPSRNGRPKPFRSMIAKTLARAANERLHRISTLPPREAWNDSRRPPPVWARRHQKCDQRYRCLIAFVSHHRLRPQRAGRVAHRTAGGGLAPASTREATAFDRASRPVSVTALSISAALPVRRRANELPAEVDSRWDEV